MTFDTNLFIYMHDARFPEKKRSAGFILTELTRRKGSMVGLQVVGETYTVLTRKLKDPPQRARALCEALLFNFISFGYDGKNVAEALERSSEGRVSYWGGLLLSAAADAGCTHFISEDMQSGTHFGSLEIIAPFAADHTPAPRLMDLIAA